MRAAGAAAVAAAAAIVISGCGAANTVSQAVDPVARAAETTSRVQGYRMSASVTINTAVGPVKSTMSGVMDRVTRTGEMTSTESVAGHSFAMSERLSGLTVYMNVSSIPGLDQLTHGKQWLKMDMSRAFGSLGVGSLSTTSSDPSQFVDYLRAVSDNTRKVGTDTVRGVATTRYRAVIDLRKYPNVAPPGQRATAKRAITRMEEVLGGHTMPMDVWIDHDRLVRRMSFTMGECVNRQKLSMDMTMDLYDYGPQHTTPMPSGSQTFDLNPLVAGSMQNLTFGCTSSSSS